MKDKTLRLMPRPADWRWRRLRDWRPWSRRGRGSQFWTLHGITTISHDGVRLVILRNGQPWLECVVPDSFQVDVFNEFALLSFGRVFVMRIGVVDA